MFRHIPKKALLLFAVDAQLVSLAFFLAPVIRNGTLALRLEFSWGWAITLFIYLFTFYLADLYSFGERFKSGRFLFRYIAAVSVASLIVAAVLYYVPNLTTGRGAHFINSLSVFLFVYCWRYLFEWYFAWLIERPRKLLIVGAGKAGRAIYEALKSDAGYHVVGFIDDDTEKHGRSASPMVLGGSSTLSETLRSSGADSVVMALKQINNPALVKGIFDCKMNGIQVFDMPFLYERLTGKVPVEHVDDLWFVHTPIAGVRRNVYNLKLKRVADIALSTAGLALGFPLALMVAAAVKAESRGPVLFRQRRVGLNGRQFNLLKFRTMTDGKERDREFAGQKDDPRITRVGRILRLSRLDEMPQMWNVLKGEMSFIGPRALMEEEAVRFGEAVPYFSLRHSIRPGITGWAQVNYRHGVSAADALEKLQYDLYYIKNLSPILDFSIIFSTVKVVMWGKGAR